MMRFFSADETGVKPLRSAKPGCWIDAVSPTADEITEVSRVAGIPEDLLKVPLDEDERPRTEKEGTVTILIVRVPTEENSGDISITTIPLGIFLTKKCIVTLALKESPPLNDLKNGTAKRFSTKAKSKMVLRLLSRMNHHFLRYLNRIEKEVDKLEASLSRSFKNEEIVKLLNFQKTLVYFNNSILGNGQVIERIHKGAVLQLSGAEKEILEDITIENQQAKETTKIFSDILSNTMDAYVSIVSNNLNIVMKFLASITIILSFPTMVASFYGMNVGLPLQENPLAFLLTILFSFFISITAAAIFWNRKWL
jgi:magnesium transporter